MWGTADGFVCPVPPAPVAAKDDCVYTVAIAAINATPKIKAINLVFIIGLNMFWRVVVIEDTDKLMRLFTAYFLPPKMLPRPLLIDCPNF